MRDVLPVLPVRTCTHIKYNQPDDASDGVPSAKRASQCWTSRVASQLTTVGEPQHLTRKPSESMCKLARRKLFKPGAIEEGDKTFLTIPLFNYNLLSKH
jgi:hypothetical protein